MSSEPHYTEILKWNCMNGYQMWKSAIHQTNWLWTHPEKKEHIHKQNISQNLLCNEK